jgi:hypothetical protein
MTDPLPKQLADLFAAERAAPIADVATRSVVRATIAAKVGSAPLGAAVGGTLGGVGKVIAIVALTVGAGTAAVVGTRDDSSPRRPVEQAQPRQPAAEPTAHEQAAPNETAANEMSIDPPLRTAPSAKPQTSSRARSSQPKPVERSQAELLRDATAAWLSGDTASALELLQKDKASHPTGELAEERDALEIRALSKQGRVEDARTAAERFIARYPDSVHRALIQRAVKALP